jgi:hypothetical protein
VAANDTSDDAATMQLEIYRRMSPQARLQVGLELTALSRELLVMGIRQRHPEYDERQIHLAFLRLWVGAPLFAKAFPGAPELLP